MGRGVRAGPVGTASGVLMLPIAVVVCPFCDQVVCQYTAFTPPALIEAFCNEHLNRHAEEMADV